MVSRTVLSGRKRAALGVSALVLTLVQGMAQAQTAAPAKPDSNSNDIKTPFLDNYTPSEEMKRRAMGPLRIIKQMGDKKASAPAPTPAPAAATAPAPSPAPVAARPRTDDSARTKASAVDAPETAATVAAPAPAPVIPMPQQTAPAPAVAKAAPPPPPVKEPNLELIPIRQDPPVYNRSLMRDASGDGLVKVAFDVNPDGSTGDIQIVSSNNRRLNNSAKDAVAKWKFKPIDEEVRVEIELRFSMD